MIFKSIKLENFRQYKGIVDVTFSSSREKPITLILADNGVGKTTFLQAFRFCFYGNLLNNKYIKLPNPHDLLNNTIINDVHESDIVPMSVTIEFEKDNKKYIMKRVHKYKKFNNTMTEYSEESSLSYSTDYEGLRTIVGAEADIEMSDLLPAGLSHIFMFDGERMEKDIGSKEFQDELKESILGILGIKKYDELIDKLGNQSLKRSVIGRVHHSRSTSNIQAKRENLKYNSLLEKKNMLLNEKKSNDERLVDIDKEIKNYGTYQEKISSNQSKLIEKGILEQALIKLENSDNNISRQILNNGLKAYKYQILLSNKEKYDEFITAASKTDNFYKSIHINTIEQILEERKCICGNSVLEDSVEYRIINKLKEIALPESRAQNLSYIESFIYSKVKEYNELIIQMKNDKQKQSEIAAELQSLSAEKERLEQEIKQNEKLLGENYQKNIEDLEITKLELIKKNFSLEQNIELCEKSIIQSRKILEPIWAEDKKNSYISVIVSDLELIKENLTKEKEKKESEARLILAKHFDKYISKVLQGDYTSEIDDNYSIKVIDNKTGLNDIDVLSTGQNVITSVSFINSLIETAIELSNSSTTNSRYGVIMDAAFSNLDEKHIKQVGDNNLKSLDQLIFLAFKRQIRGELYNSIKDEIGKAYVLNIDGLDIVKETIDIENLKEFVDEEAL